MSVGRTRRRKDSCGRKLSEPLVFKLVLSSLSAKIPAWIPLIGKRCVVSVFGAPFPFEPIRLHRRQVSRSRFHNLLAHILTLRCIRTECGIVVAWPCSFQRSGQTAE